EGIFTRDFPEVNAIGVLVPGEREIVVHRSNLLTLPPLPGDAAEMNATSEAKHFGKDCPKGKVQIEFVGCDPNARYSEYGYKPMDRAFLEIYVDGNRYPIDVGTFDGPDGSRRRGLHINGPFHFQVDKHSVNACD